MCFPMIAPSNNQYNIKHPPLPFRFKFPRKQRWPSRRLETEILDVLQGTNSVIQLSLLDMFLYNVCLFICECIFCSSLQAGVVFWSTMQVNYFCIHPIIGIFPAKDSQTCMHTYTDVEWHVFHLFHHLRQWTLPWSPLWHGQCFWEASRWLSQSSCVTSDSRVATNWNKLWCKWCNFVLNDFDVWKT